MPQHIISTDQAPSSPLYSQGVRAGSTIYVSGMVGIDVATCRQALQLADEHRNTYAIVGQHPGVNRALRVVRKSRISSELVILTPKVSDRQTMWEVPLVPL